ncbi:hypothetical protein [Streptococcus mitis]|uniref:hypothetical protein n=1 Tax=Streptococcus mitis TaxID=28037 RepID=UPI002283DAE6|nr:hypothetical protein [Streptococcus mitis]MCY7152821.1 hypothetical protein [Streptococcus mitis]MDU4441712.1 hypothetical protein [Streptococcus mitis]MDU4467365.1 hypothetical protein [Streptococcus mitis]
MSRLFNQLKSIKDPIFFEKIISLFFEVILTCIAFKTDSNSLLKIIFLVLIILYCLYTSYRIYILWCKYTKNIFSQDEEIKEYMKKWVNKDGQTVIVSRDLSWVDPHDDTYQILVEKAKNAELTIILQEPKEYIRELEIEGARIYDYSHLNFTPKNRFTFIHYGRSNPRLAIGYQDGDVRKIREYEKSGTIEYSLAEDLCNLLKEVSKNESSSTKTQ